MSEYLDIAISRVSSVARAAGRGRALGVAQAARQSIALPRATALANERRERDESKLGGFGIEGNDRGVHVHVHASALDKIGVGPPP